MWLRVCPPILLNTPPAKILPSACTAIEWTLPFAFGSNESAGRSGIEPGDMVARLSADAGELAARQNLAVRLHRDRIDTTVRVRVERISQAGRGIEPGDMVARLSADAGELAARQNLAVRLHRDCIDSTVRVRVERISHSGRSIEPGDAIARLSADAVVKKPPAKILPSACTAIEWTASFAFGLKAVSSVPSVFKRAMLLRVTPKTVLNSPPIRILPSGCTAVAVT